MLTPMTQIDSSDRGKLDAARRAFEAGNYARVRHLCDALTHSADTDTAREAAELRKRTGIDVVQPVVLGLCLLFFCFVVWKYLF